MEEILKHFLTAIDTASWAEIDAMAEAVAVEHEEKTERIRSQIERDAQTRCQAELSDIARDERLAVDARRAENRRKQLALREELARKTAQTLRARVDAFTAAPEYPAHLTSLLEKALTALGEPAAVTVYLRREDLPLADTLKKKTRGTDVTAVEGDFALGGLIVEAPERGRRADMSFDRGFREAQERFGEIFGLEI
ncbi:MAG: V-type ATP synthase subunit E [Oscillospiraceae bacterium]